MLPLSQSVSRSRIRSDYWRLNLDIHLDHIVYSDDNHLVDCNLDRRHDYFDCRDLGN